MISFLKRICSAFIIITIFLFNNIALAGDGFSIIRDQEIEENIYKLIEGVLRAASIDPSTMKVVVLNDKSINAFVTNQTTIFLHSGLLLKFYDDPDVILGVVAHELGHIKGGHLAKLDARYRDINKDTMVSTLILGAVGIAASSPELVLASIMGSGHVGERSMMRYSRQQEQIADRIAVELLEKSKNSSAGLKKIMEYFKANIARFSDKVNPYAITHPMPAQRLLFVTDYMERTKYPNSQIPIDQKNKYIRSMIKLSAFLEPEKNILASESKNDHLYAKAIIDFRKNKPQQALKTLDELIAQEPKNPYLYELKAQILFENGSIPESIIQYKQAHNLKKSDLINYEYASAIIESLDNVKKNTKQLDLVISLLDPIEEELLGVAKCESMAKAYGKKGDIGMAHYFTAKMYQLSGDQKNADKFAKIASKEIPKTSRYYILALDIIS